MNRIVTFLVLVVSITLTGCLGAFQGATFGVGGDRRTPAKKTWDSNCAACHEGRSAPVLASVPAPDLFSPKWKMRMEALNRFGDRGSQVIQWKGEVGVVQPFAQLLGVDYFNHGGLLRITTRRGVVEMRAGEWLEINVSGDRSVWPDDPRPLLNAGWMYSFFSSVCWHGRERTLDGKRPTYDNVRRTTVDGLPYSVAKEPTVVVMPRCTILDEELNAVRSWITCVHYPSSQYCRN